MNAGTVAIDTLAHDADYRSLHRIAGLRVDLRYASTRNLLGRDLYAPHDCAYLHVRAANALEQAVAWLARERPDLQLCVLDAARPQRVQELFWQHVKGTPMQPYFAPPERGSIHSFGMACDLTLLNAQGQELDLGTPFDDTSEGSHPALEHAQAAVGVLSQAAWAHRRLLRCAMARSGWQGIASEWWHFDLGERDWVRSRLRRIV